MAPRKIVPFGSPTLPGGYTAGEKVFFMGTSKTFPTGDTLEHGQKGEVVGPATNGPHKGKSVAVLFPGNKVYIDCYLTEVRPLRAASAANPTPAPRTRDAAHCPGAGGMVARPLRWQRQRGRRPSPTSSLRTTDGYVRR